MIKAQSYRASKKVLVIVTAASALPLRNGKSHSTGYFLGELMEPLFELQKAGISFDFATPGGVAPTMDQDGNRLFYWSFQFWALRKAKQFVQSSEQLRSPLTLEDLSESDLEQYAGVFVPGGHGPMVDLLDHRAMANVLQHFHRKQKPTALLCHAPSVLLSTRSESGWPYAGYKMAVTSNLEETLAEAIFLRGKVMFEYPALALSKAGAEVHTKKLIFCPNVISDRDLVTGQNPYASRQFGKVFVQKINEYNISHVEG